MVSMLSVGLTIVRAQCGRAMDIKRNKLYVIKGDICLCLFHTFVGNLDKTLISNLSYLYAGK